MVPVQADTDDHEAIQQQTIDVGNNVAYAGVVPVQADTDNHVTYDAAIQDATNTQQQTIDVGINVAYAGVVPVQANTDDHVTYDEAIQDATNTQQQTIVNVAHAGVVPVQADTDDHVTYDEAIQDATNTQQQTIDVDINVAYAGVVSVQESQHKDKQSATAAPKIVTSTTNFQFQESNNNPITERNIAYGVIPPKKAQVKQQKFCTSPQTVTLATNDQFPDYDYPTTEQDTSEAANPDFQATPGKVSRSSSCMF